MIKKIYLIKELRHIHVKRSSYITYNKSIKFSNYISNDSRFKTSETVYDYKYINTWYNT